MALCLPRRRRATSLATLPRTLSVASITYHSCVTSAGLALKLVMMSEETESPETEFREFRARGPLLAGGSRTAILPAGANAEKPTILAPRLRHLPTLAAPRNLVRGGFRVCAPIDHRRLRVNPRSLRLD